jgi:hypothetical protein
LPALVTRAEPVGSGDQVAWRYSERHRQLLDDGDGRVARTPLDVADIGAVDAGTVGIVLLTPAMLAAEATKVGGKALTDVHAAMKTALSTFDLQTISDNPVDFTAASSMNAVTDRRQEGGRQRGVA